MFIARKLGIRGGSSKLMLRVATVSVAVSMAVMLIALAVVGGFRTEIGNQVSGFASHIQITSSGGGHSYESEPVFYDEDEMEEMLAVEGVRHVQRFAMKAGILRGDSTIQGILLKGIGPEYDTAFLHGKMVVGVIPQYDDSTRNRDAVISEVLARTMRLELGDRFEVLFVGEEAPKRDRLRVAGMYRSGLEDFDKMLIFGDMGVVQRLNDWDEDDISGYEVIVKTKGSSTQGDIGRIEEVIPELKEIVGAELFPGWGFGSDMEVLSVRQRYSHIYDWLDMLGLNTTIVIVIMLIVAIVNMISGVLIVVLEQTRTIGILKALGMRGSMLQRVFVMRTAGITLKGMLWGNVAGLGLILIQYLTGAITLDPESYMISVVPVVLDWWAIIGLNLLVFVAVTLAMTLPTLIISNITPDRAIRFQ